MGDNSSFLLFNRDPVDRMISYLKKYFGSGASRYKPCPSGSGLRKLELDPVVAIFLKNASVIRILNSQNMPYSHTFSIFFCKGKASVVPLITCYIA